MKNMFLKLIISKFFRSGDLLYADEFGWMYFMDRMGDTYRYALRKCIVR
jgi:hypothetical protein